MSTATTVDEIAFLGTPLLARLDDGQSALSVAHGGFGTTDRITVTGEPGAVDCVQMKR